MKDDLMAEINITPLTDVILVLLIIVLLFAGAYSGLAAKTAQAAPSSAPTRQADPLKITIDEQGKIYLENREITIAELEKKLSRVKKTKTAPLLIGAAAATPYGIVLEVVIAAQKAGFSEIDLQGSSPRA